DVVVYDRLANPELLELAPAHAERVYVGKSARDRTLDQEGITALLVERARAGQVVCRLKGGDPFIFGRGGEEAEALALAGLEWEYVPGITSAIAAPGYAGIPVTHRGLGSTLAIATAHEDPSKGESSLRWEHLAAGFDTGVFLMGVERLPQLVEALLANGRAPETPAAVVSWGTYSHQCTVEGTLADIVERCQAAELPPPAVTVVGEVAALRSRLRWFDNRPLFGKRIVVTRAREQAGDLARRIRAAGGEPVFCPTIRIQPLRAPDLSGLARGYDWTIFTSVNGVYCLLAALKESGYDVRRLGAARLAAIGPETARALDSAGLRVDFVPSRFVAEQVAAEFPEPVAGKRFLIPRAREARETLPELWRGQGATVDVVPVYESVPDTEGAAETRERLAAGAVDAITFTASSTVRNFMASFSVNDLVGVKIACIGPITATTAREHGLRPDVVAETYTIAGLMEALERLFSKDNE
ncbi:MAG TPA: uroporphyrinogen-III C-methyltransferase, partial [Armatimonadota bacterium]|nr:uroporphyrinogen-III C-methyltransferase [Armatimonadota bacterium]